MKPKPVSRRTGPDGSTPVRSATRRRALAARDSLAPPQVIATAKAQGREDLAHEPRKAGEIRVLGVEIEIQQRHPVVELVLPGLEAAVINPSDVEAGSQCSPPTGGSGRGR